MHFSIPYERLDNYIIMTYHYKVAGHIFSLVSKENLGDILTNYTAFAVPEPKNDPLFSVEIVDSLPETEKVPVLTGDHGEPEMPLCNIYDAYDNWFIEMAPTGRSAIIMEMLLRKDCRIALLHITGETSRSLRFAIDNALMLSYAFSTSRLNTLEIHASVTVCDGKAYLFLGKSGTGKSTHSRMWLENIKGSHLMNDDNPVLRVWPDGRVIAYGSPWSGKTPCYRNEQADVGAIVRIVQAPENRLEAIPVPEAYATLYSSCSGLKLDNEMSDGLNETIICAVTSTPFFKMYCLPDADAAIVCHNGVAGVADY